MMTQVGRVFKTENGFVPEGWTGMADGYPLFLPQAAAMRMVHGGIYTSLPKDIRSLAQGAYGGKAEVTEEDSAAAVEFEYGRFAFPTIEGPCVQGTARANELTSGYLALPLKDRRPERFGSRLCHVLDQPAGDADLPRKQAGY